MELLLGMDGHDVRLAEDGPSALEAAETYDPDVLLLDGSMPGLDGHEVARRLERRNAVKRPLLIVLAGKDGEPTPVTDADIDLHLGQPVDPGWLQQLLKRFQQVVS
jgi:two-component system CheB/CheR fusion protein